MRRAFKTTPLILGDMRNLGDKAEVGMAFELGATHPHLPAPALGHEGHG